MIIVTSTIWPLDWTLDYDDYIAATVRWPTPRQSTPYYFRILNGDEVLVELGIDPETNVVCKLNVVSIGCLGSDMPPDVPVEHGVPVIAPSPDWVEPPARLDIRTAAKVSYVEPNLMIVLDPAVPPCLAYDAGGAWFVVGSEGRLAAVTIALPAGHHDERLQRMSTAPPVSLPGV